MDVDSLRVDRRGAVAQVWMCRPDLHNAFDERLVAALAASFASLDADPAVRVIVLAGEGRSFSAGADLGWMRRLGQASPGDNLTDASRLAELFRTIATCATPTIARVHGAALGGGMGLAAACDVCVASTAASFAASEVLLGIVPAAISPYVLRAIGERQAHRYFQTGERIAARRAREIGLVHELVEPDALDAKVDEVAGAMLSGGPAAQAAATALIRAVAHRPVDDELVAETARCIAGLRATPEAREGLGAFLEKRRPAWADARAVDVDVR